MGNIVTRRQNPRIEEADGFAAGNAYLYPPKFGNYFSTHFIMGGERFETCQPEAYLFGENMDLNFLGGKPTPFPYSAPFPHEPTRTLRALMNVRKESLRLVKIIPEMKPEADLTEIVQPHQSLGSVQKQGSNLRKPFQYNIEFTFDTDVKCSITIYYMCSEEVTSSGFTYTPRDPTRNSETYFFKRGANQLFSQSSHVFDPSIYDEDDLMYRAFDEQGNFDVTVPLPVVIQCVAQEGEEPRQSHSLIAVVERNNDNSYSIKPFKQKMFIDGLCYLFQEIYGIENKNVTTVRSSENSFISPDDEIEDNGSECVICMSDSRDTLILPCRHLCLCYACADSLRYQANNCPICRSPFRALLQIKAVRKIMCPLTVTATPPPAPSVLPHHQLSASASDLVDIPPGYEPVPLIEALNGPLSVPPSGNHGMYSFRRSSEDGVLGTPSGNRNFKLNRKAQNASVETFESSRREEKDSSQDEKWRVVQNRPRHLLIGDNSADSPTSSNISETAGNNSIQERIRLLSHDKDEESEENGDFSRKESMDDETEMTSFKMITPVKEMHTDLSPVSVGVTSGSFPILSLRDGIDEQRYMVETDLMSVTTAGSVPNILKDDDSNYYTPDGSQASSANKLFLKKQLPLVAKLAETEIADDLDLSPVED